MRNVLKKTKSPSTKHSGGNGITASTETSTSPNEETLNATRTTLRVQRNATTLLSTLAKNYHGHGINTTKKPPIQNNGSTVTAKQELNRGITNPLSGSNIRTSVNRVVVSVHSSRFTTTTWVDWIREVISKSSFNTSVTSRPPTKYDHKTVSNLHRYYRTHSRTCKIYTMYQITIQLYHCTFLFVCFCFFCFCFFFCFFVCLVALFSSPQILKASEQSFVGQCLLGFFVFVLFCLFCFVCLFLLLFFLSYFFLTLHCRSFFHLHHQVTCLIFQSFYMYGNRIIFELSNAYLSRFVIYCIEPTLRLIFGHWHCLSIFKRFIYICNEVHAEKGFMQQRFLKNNENNISRYVKLTLHYIHTQMEFQVRVRLIRHYYTDGNI